MEKRKYEKPILFSSEIGQYCYCSLSWYLQKCGYKPISPLLKQGKEKHNHYGRQLQKVRKQEIVSWIIFLIGISGLCISFFYILSKVIP